MKRWVGLGGWHGVAWCWILRLLPATLVATNVFIDEFKESQTQASGPVSSI